MSGHSRWSQIKRKKGKTDLQRGKLFSKMLREITVAARGGGGDPQVNFNGMGGSTVKKKTHYHGFVPIIPGAIGSPERRSHTIVLARW